MDTKTTIAIQIQEQVFEDTGKKRKQELVTFMCGGVREEGVQEENRRPAGEEGR